MTSPTVPETRILGPGEMYVDVGSVLNLTCVVRDSPEQPEYIFWYHGDEVRERQLLGKSRQ